MHTGCVAPTDWRWDFCLQNSLPFIVALCYFSPVMMRSVQARCGVKLPTLSSCVFWRKSERAAVSEQQLLPKPTTRMLRNAAVSKTLGIVNILYLPISRYALSAFGCIVLADGQSVMKTFPDASCESTEYYVFVFLGVLGTITCTLAATVQCGIETNVPTPPTLMICLQI